MIYERYNDISLLPKRYKLNYDDSQDLIQQTMLKAISKASSFDGKNFMGWIYIIMRNEFINSWRKNSKMKMIELDEDKNNKHTSDINLVDKNIIKCIELLPERLKNPIKLLISGYSYIEISEILNIPKGTVSASIHQARNILKQKLNQ